ncbi:MAG: nuclease-related domain-containing protein [Chloroflexota bacterium]
MANMNPASAQNVMRNDAPSNSLTRRSRALLLYGSISGSIGIFFIVLGQFLRVVPSLFSDASAGGSFQRGLGTFLVWVGAIALLAGIGLAVRALTRRRENDLAHITGDYIAQYFDRRYRFIRNINRPSLGYIDAVLVGPHGILVFRILDSSGELLNEKDGWVKKNRRGEWVPMQTNPTKDTDVDVEAVRKFMGGHRFRNLPIYGVVVFVNEPPQLIVRTERPTIPVAHLTGFYDALADNYLAEERFQDPKLIARIGDLLFGEN